MSLAQRIQLLRIECAGDRLELALATRSPPPSRATRLLQSVVRVPLGPWLTTAANVLTPFLPRKLRLVAVAARAWSRARAA